MKKLLKNYLIAGTILSVYLTGAIVLAQVNDVTGVGPGTPWEQLSAEMNKKPTVRKRFNAGLNRVLPTPVPVTGTDGGYGWAAQLDVGNILIISSDGATKGARLPSGDRGDMIVVINNSATAAFLYPAVGGTINGNVTNGATIVPASKGVLAIGILPNSWVTFDLPAKTTIAPSPTATATPTPTPTATATPTP